jgi:hypothetical protein
LTGRTNQRSLATKGSTARSGCTISKPRANFFRCTIYARILAAVHTDCSRRRFRPNGDRCSMAHKALRALTRSSVSAPARPAVVAQTARDAKWQIPCRSRGGGWSIECLTQNTRGGTRRSSGPNTPRFPSKLGRLRCRRFHRAFARRCLSSC